MTSVPLTQERRRERFRVLLAFVTGISDGKTPVHGLWEIRLRNNGLFDAADLAREMGDESAFLLFRTNVSISTNGGGMDL